MSYITDNVAKYVKNKRINLSAMSRDTGISYAALYASLSDENRQRDLRDDEFVKICLFVGKNPIDFADKQAEKGGSK